MWGEPLPSWRKARKQYQCQGDGCAQVIAQGDRYLDRSLREPLHSHLRYCQRCAEPVLAAAEGYHFFNGRNDFPDRYHKRISSTEWKKLRLEVIEQQGNRCQHCGKDGISLALHHKHYKSMGNEQPQDVELLCSDCHATADQKRRPKHEYPKEGLIVGSDGDYWGQFDPDTVYIPMPDGRNVPVYSKKKF